MLRFLVCVFLIVSFQWPGTAQEIKKKFGITVTTGLKAGWWIYHKGGSTPGINDLGWDRTHYNPKINIGTGIQYQWKKLSTQLFYSHGIFLEDEMLQHEDFVPRRKKYAIAKRAVTFEEYGLALAYDLLQSGNFALSPVVSMGKFRVNTIHPDKSNFTRQYFWQLGIQNKVDYRKVTWTFTPAYQEMTIQTNQTSGAFHKIYSFGIDLSITYWIKPVKKNETL